MNALALYSDAPVLTFAGPDGRTQTTQMIREAACSQAPSIKMVDAAIVASPVERGRTLAAIAYNPGSAPEVLDRLRMLAKHLDGPDRLFLDCARSAASARLEGSEPVCPASIAAARWLEGELRDVLPGVAVDPGSGQPSNPLVKVSNDDDRGAAVEYSYGGWSATLSMGCRAMTQFWASKVAGFDTGFDFTFSSRHSAAAATPSDVMNNKALEVAPASDRIRNTTITQDCEVLSDTREVNGLLQDGSRGEPAYVVRTSSEVIIRRGRQGVMGDGVNGEPASIRMTTAGTEIRRMVNAQPNNGRHGEPAVEDKFPDGSTRNVEYYKHGKRVNGPDGAPAKTTYVGIYNFHFYGHVPTGGIAHTLFVDSEGLPSNGPKGEPSETYSFDDGRPRMVIFREHGRVVPGPNGEPGLREWDETGMIIRSLQSEELPPPEPRPRRKSLSI